MNSEKKFEAVLEKRRQLGLLRSYEVLDPDLIDFCSNDYLGFAREFDLSSLQNLVESNKCLSGSGSARLVSGNSVFATELESFIAAFHKSEAALLAHTGYTANISVLSSIPDRHTTVIFDELVHASIRDGINLSKSKSVKFRHNDLQDLEDILKRTSGRKIVATESIFSMKGTKAPLKAMVKLCKQYDAEIFVDEAHAVGIYGDQGAGLVVAEALEASVDYRVVTFGKALGCQGAVILSTKLVRDYLVNFARPLIYSTFISPLLLVVIQDKYEQLALAAERRELLFKNIDLFVKQSEKLGIDIEASDSAIRTLSIPDTKQAKQTAEKLREAGFGVKAIVSPTVPVGSELLRVVLHSYNSEREISLLLESYSQLFFEGVKMLESTATYI